jgi:hypothetical protein
VRNKILVVTDDHRAFKSLVDFRTRGQVNSLAHIGRSLEEKSQQRGAVNPAFLDLYQVPLKRMLYWEVHESPQLKNILP